MAQAIGKSATRESATRESATHGHAVGDTVGNTGAASGNRASAAKPKTWSQRMSNHIAYALLAYTALQIFVVMQEMKGGSHSTLPYLGLVLLVAIVIPACRRFEKRWERFDANMKSIGEHELASIYRRDVLGLWLTAIGMPFAIAGLWAVGAAALA